MIETTRYRGKVTRVDSTGVWVGQYRVEGTGLAIGDLVKFEVHSNSTGDHGVLLDSKMKDSYASVNMELGGGSGWDNEGRLPSDYPLGGSRPWRS